MTWRPRPKTAEVDPYSPRAWGNCDRCGFTTNLHKLSWQMEWSATQLYNKRILVCNTCLDDYQPQLRTLVLPADPPALFNTRPENYSLDENDWLSTQDGTIINAQDGTSMIKQIPNPDTPPMAPRDDIVEQAAEQITTEDDVEIVTEQGDGNPLNYQPNPTPIFPDET
jgi:hypothetical protein